MFVCVLTLCGCCVVMWRSVLGEVGLTFVLKGKGCVGCWSGLLFGCLWWVVGLFV